MVCLDTDILIAYLHNEADALKKLETLQAEGDTVVHTPEPDRVRATLDGRVTAIVEQKEYLNFYLVKEDVADKGT